MQNKISAPPRLPLGFLLVLFGVNLAAGALSAVRLADLPALLLLILNYLCQLLTLVAQFIGLGGAFYCLSVKRNRQAFLCLLLTVSGLLLALLIAGVAESFLYLDYEYTAALLSQIGSAFVNALFYFVLYGILLVPVGILLFRHTDGTRVELPTPFGGGAVMKASLIFSGFVLGHRLVLQIIDTLDFIDTYWPSIYANEIVTLVLDYIFLLLSVLLGHIAACTSAMYFAVRELPDDGEKYE